MRSVRGVRVGALLLAVALAAAACGKSSTSSSSGGNAPAAKKIGIVYDIGGKGDKSFNDSAYRGLQAAQQKLGSKIQTRDVEPNPDGSNRQELLEGLATDGYQLVFGIGFLFSDAITAAAKDNPDVTFLVIDGFNDLCLQKKNLICISFKEQEGSFLVGAAAALKTKKNVVGFVGGQNGDLIKKFEAGYKAGVKYIGDQKGKTIKVLADYAGTTGDAFRNPTKGHELALKQISQGADVIYHASGGTGAGVIKAAAEKHVYAIGVDSDQSLTASAQEQQWILTSMLKRVDNAVEKAIEDFSAGTLDSPGTIVLGLKEGGIDYAQNQYNKSLLGDIPTTLDDLKQKIIGGQIQVPVKPAY
jgi:basic membrane protein A and related proteins